MQDLRSDRLGQVAELWMFFDESGHHRAHRDNAFPVGARCLEGLAHQDVRQTASTEPFFDLGVKENPLVTPASDGS